MSTNDFNRRDFHRLSISALGGMLAGGAVGCSSQQEPPPKSAGTSSPSAPPDAANPTGEAAISEPVILSEKHVCRGLNTCKGKGKGGENDCAGKGACALATEHTCGGSNDCKGQGGCGKDPGQNACKGQGSCHVPLMDSIWQDARTAFEKAMKETGKEFGPAPEPQKG
ncbi:MAG: hypothetical protein ACKVT0_13360 [Planctomycetaceae bacterium]